MSEENNNLSGYSVSSGRTVPSDRPGDETLPVGPPAPYHDVEVPVDGTYRRRDFDSTYKAFIAAYGSDDDHQGGERSNTFELRTARALGLGRMLYVYRSQDVPSIRLTVPE